MIGATSHKKNTKHLPSVDLGFHNLPRLSDLCGQLLTPDMSISLVALPVYHQRDSHPNDSRLLRCWIFLMKGWIFLMGTLSHHCGEPKKGRLETSHMKTQVLPRTNAVTQKQHMDKRRAVNAQIMKLMTMRNCTLWSRLLWCICRVHMCGHDSHKQHAALVSHNAFGRMSMWSDPQSIRHTHSSRIPFSISDVNSYTDSGTVVIGKWLGIFEGNGFQCSCMTIFKISLFLSFFLMKFSHTDYPVQNHGNTAKRTRLKITCTAQWTHPKIKTSIMSRDTLKNYPSLSCRKNLSYAQDMQRYLPCHEQYLLFRPCLPRTTKLSPQRP